MRWPLMTLLLLGCEPARYLPIVPPPPCAATVEAVAVGEAFHVPQDTTVTYATNPPCGGNHWGQWLPWGVFDRAVRAENYVHNLEHGGVVLLYSCADGCPELRDALIAWAQAQPADDGGAFRYIVTPWAGMSTPIAAVAWGAVYRSDAVRPCELDDFRKKHYRKAPEDVGASGNAMAVMETSRPDASSARD